MRCGIAIRSGRAAVSKISTEVQTRGPWLEAVKKIIVFGANVAFRHRESAFKQFKQAECLTECQSSREDDGVAECLTEWQSSRVTKESSG